jgi:hypothetical protein
MAAGDPGDSGKNGDEGSNYRREPTDRKQQSVHVSVLQFFDRLEIRLAPLFDKPVVRPQCVTE